MKKFLGIIIFILLFSTNANSNSGKQYEFEYKLNVPLLDHKFFNYVLAINVHELKSFGLYKGESVNGIPNGKGKWSNCYSKRYELLSKLKSTVSWPPEPNWKFVDYSCQVIIGNWKNGSLNGFAKIFPLGIPKFVYPEVELKKEIEERNLIIAKLENVNV